MAAGRYCSVASLRSARLLLWKEAAGNILQSRTMAWHGMREIWTREEAGALWGSNFKRLGQGRNLNGRYFQSGVQLL